MPKYSTPKRKQDVRIEITQSVFTELATRFQIKKGSILDGWLDQKGNFTCPLLEATIFPSHFKVLGEFVFVEKKVQAKVKSSAKKEQADAE